MKRTGFIKGLTAIILAVVFSVTQCFSPVTALGVVYAEDDIPEGSGTEAAPFLVTNEGQLRYVVTTAAGINEVYAVVENDIVLQSKVDITDLGGRIKKYHLDLNGKTITGPLQGVVFDIHKSETGYGCGVYLKNGSVSGGYIKCAKSSIYVSGKIKCSIDLGDNGALIKSGDLDGESEILVKKQGMHEYPFIIPGRVGNNLILRADSDNGISLTESDASCLKINNGDYRAVFIDSYDLKNGTVEYFPQIFALKNNISETHVLTMSVNKASGNRGGTGAYQVGDTVTVGVPPSAEGGTIDFYVYSNDQPVYRFYHDGEHNGAISEVSYTIKESDLGKKLRAVIDIYTNTYHLCPYSAQSPTVTAKSPAVPETEPEPEPEPEEPVVEPDEPAEEPKEKQEETPKEDTEDASKDSPEVAPTEDVPKETEETEKKSAEDQPVENPTQEQPAEPVPTGSSSSSSTASSSQSSAIKTVKTSSEDTRVTTSSGKPVTNAIVTVEQKDASGKISTKQVLTDDSGNIAKKEVVSVSQEVSKDGKTKEVTKSYLAAEDGTIYDTPGFAEVESVSGVKKSDIADAGKVVYIKEDGSLMQGEKFSITTKSGKKISYAADNDCNIIRSGFFNAKHTDITNKSVKSGATYFAGADGKLITNALFTVKTSKKGKVKVKIKQKGSKTDAGELSTYLRGAATGTKSEQYYATDSGKLAKSTWVSVGKKDYYCGASGRVIKSKKRPINNV